MERRIEFKEAYDKRDPNPAKNYGIHGCDMRWYLIGEHGAVQFVVFTNWYLPHVSKELEERGHLGAPIPADLGYHSKIARYEGQEPMDDECNVIGCQCFYDGSSLNAEPIYRALVAEGSEAVWKELEAYYVDTFGELV